MDAHVPQCTQVGRLIRLSLLDSYSSWHYEQFPLQKLLTRGKLAKPSWFLIMMMGGEDVDQS